MEIALLVALVATNAIWLWLFSGAMADWAKERREFITRILHPEVVPVPDQPNVVPTLQVVDDEYDKVGKINTAPEDDNGDGN